MRGWGKIGLLVALWAGLPAGLAADDGAEVARQVAVAVAAGDGERLRVLATSDDPDPWLVADELLGAGEAEAAVAFAGAAPREATRQLPEYVRTWSPRQGEAEIRRALAEATAVEDAEARAARLEALGHAADDALAVRTHLARGYALRAKHVLLGSAGAFEHAAEVAGRIGWRAAEAQALYEAGASLFTKGSYADALETFRRRLAVERALRDDVGIARGHYGIALTMLQLSKGTPAARHLREARERIEAARDFEYLAKLQGTDAMRLARTGHYAESLAGFEAALDTLERVGERPLAARFRAAPLRLARQRVGLLLNASSMAGQVERWDDYERYGREAMERAAALGDERLRLESEAQHLTAEAEWLRIQGENLEAEEKLALALEHHERLGNRPEEVDLLRRIAQAQGQRGDFVGALDRLDAADAIVEELGIQQPRAQLLCERGTCLTRLGEYEAAHECLMTALDLAVELELPVVQLDVLMQLGEHHLTRGDQAEALHWFGEMDAVKLPPGVPRYDADRAFDLGRLYKRLGDEERALALYREALAGLTSPSDANRAALVRRCVVAMQIEGGEYESTRTLLEAELERATEAENLVAVADILSLLGHIAYKQGRREDARSRWLATEAIYADLGNPLWLARVRLDLARVHVWTGDFESAQTRLDQVLPSAERLQLSDFLAHVCGVQALVYLRTGELEAARRWARRGVDQAVFVGRRLAEGEGAEVRSYHEEMYETGARAAARADDADDLYFFLEVGRAATLLASLDGGAALEGELPSDARREEVTARTDEVRALAAYRRAVRDGDLQGIKRTRSALDAARARLRDVVYDIQRRVRRGAASVLPRPTALTAVQRALAPGEALVLCGLTASAPLALVLRPDGERIVSLGNAAELDAELDALLSDEEPFVRPEGVAAVAARLLGRLELGDDVHTVLVSPEGRLAQVPFTLLAPERDVVLVPSASAWMRLGTRPVERGERVLAYGDPTYGEDQELLAPARLRRGAAGGLDPLPRTADEATAVGDVTRLHGEASETRLRADLAAGTRWRAVHLACHGLLDLDRPAFSALALATDEENDGFLTALDVYRMRIPTDLAVLSACDTGRGREVGGEGLFGLPRAFLHAGASSVLVSLWPVDDDATAALMARFYETWSPKGGDVAAVPAATALREAQAWLREQPQWHHPRFWAGWVLWGRAD